MQLDPFAKILLSLQENGSISKSKISKVTLRRLQPLIDSQIIELKRIRAGQSYLVNNSSGLDRFVEGEFPSGLKPLTSLSQNPRAQAIALKKDAHKAKSNQLPLFLRGFGEAKLIKKDIVLPVAELTKIAGGAAITIDPQCSWSFSGTIVTVENSELYFNIEKVIPKVDIAINTVGRNSSMLIDWFASDHLKNAQFIHCGDFDPVGLQEYLKIKAKCPARTRLYIPPEMEKMFVYANPERVRKQKGILKNLRHTDDEEVLSVIKLLDKYNGGVDQEILLHHLAEHLRR
jgi:hypothetical protein